MATTDYTYPLYARFLHLGLAAFGISAWLTAEGADAGVTSTGYLLHAYLGLSLAGFMLVRIAGGVAGRGPLRFSGWSPFSRQQWALALQDVAGLIRFKVPERGMHEGLAGLTQAFGLILFAWMGLSGTAMYLLGGGAESEWFEAIEEMHEVGETLIPVYLVLHVGSVLVHSLAGQHIWRRMWTFRKDQA